MALNLRIVAADHSCEFSQGNALSLTSTVTEKKKKKARRVAEFPAIFGSTLRLAVRMNLPGRRSADGCPDG